MTSRKRWWCGMGVLAASAVLAAVGWSARDWFLPGATNRSEPAAGSATPGVAGSLDGRGNSSPDASERQPERTPLRFEERLSTGIRFVHCTGTNSEKPFPAANGSGIAACDFDRDGRVDLYFLTGQPFPLGSGPAHPNHAYRNLGGFAFEDVSSESGLDVVAYCAGVAAGDVDGDGFPDLYLNNFGPNLLLLNQGDGTFRRAEIQAGVDDPAWGTSAAFFDGNGDGHLDLYVGNYARWSWETNEFCGDRQRGVRIYCSPHSVEPAPDTYFESNGDGTFRNATADAGLAQRVFRTQGIVAADLDGDSRTDLYVSNDLHPNSLYLNDGGTFRDQSERSGTGYDRRGSMQAGMGVDAADVNFDGLGDLFVTNYEKEYNALYLALPDLGTTAHGPPGDSMRRASGLYADASHQMGVAGPSVPWVGWGTAFLDFNLDARPDLIVANGHTDDNLAELGRTAPHAQPALLFWHTGRGFQLAADGGDYFETPHVGRALSAADLDNDGDADVVIGHQDGTPAVLANVSETDAARRRIQIRLVGSSANRDAVGAVIEVVGAAQPRQYPIKGGGSYLSAHDPRQTIPFEPGAETISLRIIWPGGHADELPGLRPGAGILIESEPGAGSARWIER